MDAQSAPGWQVENAEAIRQRQEWLKANGLPLADIQMLETGVAALQG